MTSRTAVPGVSLKLEPTSEAQAVDAEEGRANDKAATAEDSMKVAVMAIKERQDRENDGAKRSRKTSSDRQNPERYAYPGHLQRRQAAAFWHVPGSPLTGYLQRASLDPLLPDDTQSPRNRRISILLLRHKVSEKAAAVKKAAETTASRKTKKKKPAPAAPKQD
jgi:hypothetical protein